MSWDKDALWSKAKINIDKALVEDRGDEMFPFWISLSLELLARAALASVSPLLLAEKNEKTNILYALGKPIGGDKPKSISISSGLKLCRALISDFGDEELSISLALADLRNEELHTGGNPFSKMPSPTWLTNFYKAAESLCKFQGHTLEDYLGPDEALAARAMIKADTAAVKAKVQKSLNTSRAAFNARPPEEKAALSVHSKARSVTMAWFGGHHVTCPACGSVTYLTGDPFALKDPVLEDGEIVVRTTMLPIKMKCDACGLTLDNHNEMLEAGIGQQYTRTQRNDPASFYSDDSDEPEYDNE